MAGAVPLPARMAPANMTGAIDRRTLKHGRRFMVCPSASRMAVLLLTPTCSRLPARGLGVAEAYAHALLRAVFADDLPAVDRAVCIACASRVGLDRDAFATALDDENTWKERERVTAKAIEQGAFGVPTFVVNQRLFWGNDRIVLLRHALLQTGPF